MCVYCVWVTEDLDALPEKKLNSSFEKQFLKGWICNIKEMEELFSLFEQVNE